MPTLCLPADLHAGRYPGIGRLSVRPAAPEHDLPTLHAWFNHPHARFWGMNGHGAPRIADYLHQLLRNPHADGFIGCRDGEALFWVETYDPRHDPVGAHYPVAPGDCGMHFLVAPPVRPVHGLTRAVMRCIQDWLFSDPAVRRIVVEPDIENHKIHPINLDAGFVYQGQIELPTKRAWLGLCPRSAHPIPESIRA
jgi:RimJ/RimL family protein N-acetyltransferase